jgi:hypothetical protein
MSAAEISSRDNAEMGTKQSWSFSERCPIDIRVTFRIPCKHRQSRSPVCERTDEIACCGRNMLASLNRV